MCVCTVFSNTETQALSLSLPQLTLYLRSIYSTMRACARLSKKDAAFKSHPRDSVFLSRSLLLSRGHLGIRERGRRREQGTSRRLVSLLHVRSLSLSLSLPRLIYPHPARARVRYYPHRRARRARGIRAFCHLLPPHFFLRWGNAERQADADVVA